MSYQRDKDLLEFCTSFEINVYELKNEARLRLLSTHLNWLEADPLPHTTGHMIETIMLMQQWQVTHRWMYRITEDGKIPGYKSLENHVRQVMNSITVARWNDGYHADLCWSVVLPNGSQLEGDLEIEHETKETANGL